MIRHRPLYTWWPDVHRPGVQKSMDKVISDYKTYLGFFISMTSGQVIKKNPLYLLWSRLISVESYRTEQLLTIEVENLHCLPLERSFEVTRGHQPLFVNNFWSYGVRRGIGVSTLVSVRWIDWYAIWPISVTTWPWTDLTWGQILTFTFQCHFIYGSTRLNETNTMVSESLLYL